MSALKPALLKTNRVNRFGWIPFHNKPKSDQDWERIFERHPYVLPSLDELTVTLSRRGAGVAGLRRFRFDVLPAIQHHNRDLKVTVVVDNETLARAEVSVKKRGEKEARLLDCRKKRDAAILEELYAIDPASSKVPYVHESERLLQAKATKKD